MEFNFLLESKNIILAQKFKNFNENFLANQELEIIVILEMSFLEIHGKILEPFFCKLNAEAKKQLMLLNSVLL
jgi:hypothetical protein